RASDCKSLFGPFGKLLKKHGARARKVADKLREDLEDILAPFPWVGFGLAVSMPDYKDVFHIAPAARLLYPEDDPTEAAYAKLMCNIARAVRRNAPDCEIAYVIDNASFSGMIADAFKA